MSIAGQSASPFGAFVESPFHARGGGGDIYFIVNDTGTTHIYGINSETGATLFDRTLSNASHISVGPTGRVYVTRTSSNEIVRIAPEDGSTIATYSVTSPRLATCVGTSVVYSATTSNRFASVDEDFVAEEWSYTSGVSPSNHIGTVIDAAGNSYWVDRTRNTGFVVKLNASGVEQWKVNPPANFGYVTAPAYFDAALFLARVDSTTFDPHTLVKMSASAGTEVASVGNVGINSGTIAAYSIAVTANGKVFIIKSDTFGGSEMNIERFSNDLATSEGTYDIIAVANFCQFVVPTGTIIGTRRLGPGFSTDNQVACLTPALSEVWVKTIGTFGVKIATAACGGYIARA